MSLRIIQTKDLVKTLLIPTQIRGHRKVRVRRNTKTREWPPRSLRRWHLDTYPAMVSLVKAHNVLSGLGGLGVSAGPMATSFLLTSTNSREGLGGHSVWGRRYSRQCLRGTPKWIQFSQNRSRGHLGCSRELRSSFTTPTCSSSLMIPSAGNRRHWKQDRRPPLTHNRAVHAFCNTSEGCDGAEAPKQTDTVWCYPPSRTEC